jgi:two-component system chemotaxis sensor kinase CheA
VVIKSIGAALGQVDGVSGSAIMGDGRVGLILDVAGIIRIAHGITKDKEAA